VRIYIVTVRAGGEDVLVGIKATNELSAVAHVARQVVQAGYADPVILRVTDWTDALAQAERVYAAIDRERGREGGVWA
jgi:hypothetical protein